MGVLNVQRCKETMLATLILEDDEAKHMLFYLHLFSFKTPFLCKSNCKNY